MPSKSIVIEMIMLDDHAIAIDFVTVSAEGRVENQKLKQTAALLSFG